MDQADVHRKHGWRRPLRAARRPRPAGGESLTIPQSLLLRADEVIE
jgi:hypothetical protein